MSTSAASLAKDKDKDKDGGETSQGKLWLVGIAAVAVVPYLVAGPSVVLAIALCLAAFAIGVSAVAQAEPARQTRTVAIWLSILVGIAFFTSLNNGFHFDDSHSVEANVAIRSVLNIPSFWTDSRTSSFIPENRVYRPLVYTFYSFCWALGQGATWPFHLMKMGMQVLVSLALFLIWRRLWTIPGWFPAQGLRLKFPLVSRDVVVTRELAAFLLAALFAIHPACSECVVYVSATTSLQCAMFYVWAFWMYLTFRDTGDKRRLFASLFLYFLSVASKEEGITLPAVIVLLELFMRPQWHNHWNPEIGRNRAPARVSFGSRVSKAARFIFGAAIPSWPYWIMLVLMGIWIGLMHPESGNESRGWVSPMNYFITQWRAYLWYFRLWFWPWDLNADVASMEFSKSVWEPLAIQAALGNLAIISFAWLCRKRYPAMLFGLIWFYVTISPASSVVVLAEAINEHRMYLSYVGFVGGTFTVLLHWADSFLDAETRAPRLGFALSLIVMGLVTGVQERNRVWGTDEALWQDTVEKNPTSGRALNNLALVYLSKGEWAKSIELLDKCELYWNTYMYCPLNKAVALEAEASEAEKAGKKDEMTQKYAQAESSLRRAYSLNPHNVHNNFHLGKFYEEVKKDYAQAADYYRTSVDLTGGRYPAADIRLGSVLLKLHKTEEAQAAFDRAVSVEPDPTGLLFDIGKAQLDGGMPAASMQSYGRVVKLNPNHLQAWYNLGVAAVAAGDFKAARTAFERTVALDPRSEQGWFNLSFVTEQLGDGKAAVGAAQQLLTINPMKPEFQARLRDAQRKFGGAS